MKRATKRYWVTLLFGISWLAVFVIAWGSIFVALAEFKAAEPIRILWLVAGLAGWATVAYFVAREKGHSLLWTVAVFVVAPLLIVLLLLPHATGRQAELERAGAA